MFNVEITSKMRRLLEFLKNYKNYFDFKNTKILFKHEDEDHVINLILDTESSYELLYILFKTELNILKNYLLKNLILNRIQEFTSCTNTLMLFIFKKNNSFRLYINYKGLNILIIKNKCMFSLINEMLNRSVNVAYFIKFDFKNTYHRIEIRKNDE